MLIGLLASLGVSMVANFQEGPQLVTHTIGALLYFIGIEVYFFAQLVVAYMLRPRMTSIHLANFRLVLALTTVAVLVFHITCLFAAPFVKEIDGKKPTENVPASGIVRHKKGDPFYANWLATTISEWVLAFLILLQILTYCYDFAMVKIPSQKGFHADCIKHEKANWSDEPPEQCNSTHPPCLVKVGNTFIIIDTDTMITAPAGYGLPRTIPRTTTPLTYNDRYQYF
ncbi:hypothetical protein Aduo_018500 [Ancylostoma duodenale]